VSLIEYYDKLEGNPARQRKIVNAAHEIIEESMMISTGIKLGFLGFLFGSAAGVAVGWGFWL
jgi:hypothetical protein